MWSPSYNTPAYTRDVKLVSLIASRQIPPALRAGLEGVGELYFWPELSYAEQENIGPQAEVLIGAANSCVNAELLRRFPQCRMIASFGVGYDGYDLDVLASRGIVLTNTPDVLSDDVADLAFGMMISLSRDLPAADRWVREGRWPDGAFALQRSVSGKRLGIYGLGRIGHEVARRGEGFRMEIGYYDRTPKSEVWRRFDSLRELAVWCDYLVVIVPGTPQTRHSVDEDVLTALGTQGILINVARGSVVDTDALIKALRLGAIAGAGIDVYEHEPYVEAELKKLPNTLLTPHIGTATTETRRAMAELVVQNVRAFLSGTPPLTPVRELAGAMRDAR